MNEQIIQQVKSLVAAAQSGDQQATQQLNQIVQAAQNGDQQAQQIVQIIQQLTQKAAMGAKLNYIKQLRGICPNGYEMKKFAVGGKVITKCMACGGKQELSEGGPVAQFKEARAKRKREGKPVNNLQPDKLPKKSK